jgi:RecA-family ATPase
VIGTPLHFDFSGEPPDPDWIVDGMLERGTLTVLSAAPSAGKSFLMASLAVAVVQGQPWLGRPTHGQRAVYVDGENLPRQVRWRFQGLGMRNEDREHLRYHLRSGVRIGEGNWLEKVTDEVEKFNPDLFILDTATSTLAIKSGNDNSEVGNIMTLLRGLCGDMALVLITHERKPANGEAGRGDAGAAMLGGVQWQGQADSHIALSKQGKVEKKQLPNGGHRKKYRMLLEVPKNREGEDGTEELAIMSDHAPNGKPLKTRVVKL